MLDDSEAQGNSDINEDSLAAKWSRRHSIETAESVKVQLKKEKQAQSRSQLVKSTLSYAEIFFIEIMASPQTVSGAKHEVVKYELSYEREQPWFDVLKLNVFSWKCAFIH